MDLILDHVQGDGHALHNFIRELIRERGVLLDLDPHKKD